ncbi:MAG: TetR/AcrR family transcriptional regulator [Ruminococcaceae bacterium]|nr:TetR/AcrR family transcriptional regulator [Oscillospiraceae bacterium]
MAGKMTSRRQQAMQMRSRIQKAALDLFDKEGFENVSVEQIAHEVGCSVGNIYHYFKSKDELALQVTDNVDQIYLELEKEYAADTKSTAYDKLLDFVGQALHASAEEEVLYKAFIQGLKYPEQGALKDSDKRVYHRLLRQMVAACQAEGSISAAYTVAEVVEMLVALHRGMLFEWRIYESDFDLVGRGRKMAAALLKGLK